jgi:hypothetical protein
MGGSGSRSRKSSPSNVVVDPLASDTSCKGVINRFASSSSLLSLSLFPHSFIHSPRVRYLRSNSALSRDHLFLLWREYGKSERYSRLTPLMADTFLLDFFSAWGVHYTLSSTEIKDLKGRVFRDNQPTTKNEVIAFDSFIKLFKGALEGE